MDIFQLCHYLTCSFFYLYNVMQQTNCKIFSYSHIMYTKFPVAGEHSISIIYILRSHFFIQNDSYSNILIFGPLIQSLLYDTSTMTSSSPQTGMQVIKITFIILSHITTCYPYMPSPPFTLHAKLSYSVLFSSSPCSNSNNHKEDNKE